MMKLILTTAVLVAVATAATNTCQMKRGKKLFTFSSTQERIKIPCKYNAIKNTVCGDWKITITPGNAIETDHYKRYVVKTMWIGVQRISTGLTWEGRTDIKIATKYMNGVKNAPANKKGGILETSDVFSFAANDVDNLVILYEKNGQFKITYGVYEPGGRWHQTSGFQFDCYSNTFVPTDYPTQLCGQGLPDEVKAYRNANGWTEDRRATIFYNVFTNTAIVQTNPCCVDTASAMQSVCTTVAQRYNASKLCWPIVGDGLFHKCVTSKSESAESAMKHCVEYVCSGFTDIGVCQSLANEIDYCHELDVISNQVRTHCEPTLMY